ncbi:extensin family protein [Azorhizobium sp. AG788]|uniref:extensin family protein n=1 Tax=Azorhizobium sp. AG788 TaxID=2183897 RepID=UPI003138649E
MSRGVIWSLLAPLLCIGLLTGCRFDMFDRREPWRAQAEEKCLAEKGVVPSVYIEPMRGIDGNGACGMEHPFKVAALNDGTIGIEPKATLACPMIRELDVWLAEVVQPAAMAWYGAPVVAIKQISSYSCRGMNGQAGAKISEHAFGNALDVAGFRFANGMDISVKNGWRGPAEARGFLLQVQAGACEAFTTVLAPGSNIFHYDHIHVDLMRRNNPRLICKPKPQLMQPPPLMTSAPAPGFPQGGIEPRGPVMQAPLPQMQAEPPAQAEEPEQEAQEAPEMAPQAEQPQPGAPQPIQPRPGYGVQGLPAEVSAPQSQQQRYPQQGYNQRGEPVQAAPPSAYPQQGYPPGWKVQAQPVRGVPPLGQPQPAQPGDAHQPVLLPPGSLPSQPRPPGPMSYAAPGPTTAKGPFTEAGIAVRRYYSIPIPQASPIPLPRAIPGED